MCANHSDQTCVWHICQRPQNNSEVQSPSKVAMILKLKKKPFRVNQIMTIPCHETKNSPIKIDDRNGECRSIHLHSIVLWNTIYALQQGCMVRINMPIKEGATNWKVKHLIRPDWFTFTVVVFLMHCVTRGSRDQLCKWTTSCTESLEMRVPWRQVWWNKCHYKMLYDGSLSIMLYAAVLSMVGKS